MSSANVTEIPNDTRNGASDVNKSEMFETFQSWALQNYGDTGKTKTVTRKKYNRIVRILSGEEEATTENSKFRFWVKAKGFRLGPLDSKVSDESQNRILHVPTKHSNDPNCNETKQEYRRVAIVEDFFDIIYNVHVDMDGRGGKHAGQKRTYRAIAETYSFLPREAVTRFLMACSDCQKRMHLVSDTSVHNDLSSDNENGLTTTTTNGLNGPLGVSPPIIDFNVPITQTYLNHLRNKGYFLNDIDMYSGYEESVSSADSEMSREPSPNPTEEPPSSPANNNNDTKTATPPPKDAKDENSGKTTPVITEKHSDSPMDEAFLPLNMSGKVGSPMGITSHPERKRRASEESTEGSTKTSELGANDDSQCGKDDDDDDDNDDDEKIPPGQDIDPERLKSFNMFCRLFVDENLDRMVPISKQPKDKVQAILEACDRQFPEFHERSRKRIRTYLKSCRRMRRSKEQNGWEPLRPTPPHLTSAAAESILAQACENEANNAKRMRMGLEPLPASQMQALQQTTPAAAKTTPQPSPPPAQAAAPPTSTPAPSLQQPSQPPRSSTPQLERHSTTSNEFIRHQPPPPAFRPPPEFHPPFFPNGNGLFRPGFPPGYQHPAHHHPPVIQHSPIQPVSVQNGPTDLSMKKQSSKSQLSTSEIATIKQLIAGYRESAAFLYRSADELEQLLLQQN